MKLKFLGTAAAEGVPAVFCNCSACKRARSVGGKNIRTRSQILIDGDTLYDFPMDTYMHALRFGIDLSAIKRVLITHSHMDHCYPQEFCMRGEPFAHNMTEKTVDIFCNAAVKEMFLSDTAREIRENVKNSINVRTLSPFETVEDGDMTIIALPASHTVGEDCLVYYVQRAGVGALLLNDTGILDAGVYERLHGFGAKVDIAVFDCTYGATKRGRGRHMGLYDVTEQIELVGGIGLFKQNVKLIATHLSHNTDLDHDGISKLAEPYGITVAYDGMEISAGE